MVTRFGMSEKLGNVDLATNFKSLSSETKEIIESEVRRTIEEGRVRAERLLTEKRNELDLLAQALLSYEILNKDEVVKVVKGEKLENRIAVQPVPIKVPDQIDEGGLGQDFPPVPGAEAPAGQQQGGGAPPPAVA